jgi:hypothetical protein
MTTVADPDLSDVNRELPTHGLEHAEALAQWKHGTSEPTHRDCISRRFYMGPDGELRLTTVTPRGEAMTPEVEDRLATEVDKVVFPAAYEAFTLKLEEGLSS